MSSSIHPFSTRSTQASREEDFDLVLRLHIPLKYNNAIQLVFLFSIIDGQVMRRMISSEVYQSGKKGLMFSMIRDALI